MSEISVRYSFSNGCKQYRVMHPTLGELYYTNDEHDAYLFRAELLLKLDRSDKANHMARALIGVMQEDAA